MKILIFNSEEFEAERIVKTTDSITGYVGKDEVFSFRGVSDFSLFSIVGEWDEPEPSPTDLLGEELTTMKLQSIEQQALIGTMGEQLVQSKLEGMQQQQTIGALGAELAATKLEVIKLKGDDKA